MMIAPYPSCAWSLALCWLALGLAGVCRAVDVTLAWDPNSEADVSGYVVAMGTNDGGPYPQRWPVAGRLNTQLVVSNLSPGRYYFVAQAVNASNLVSDFSNQVETPIAAPPRLEHAACTAAAPDLRLRRRPL